VAKINEVVYSIGWAHEVSGFENPCHSFLVKSVVEGARRQLSHPCTKIKVITKLPNSEQSYKGKVKTHNYINRQNQSTTGKLGKP
jgi:hypothetical protein